MECEPLRPTDTIKSKTSMRVGRQNRGANLKGGYGAGKTDGFIKRNEA